MFTSNFQIQNCTLHTSKSHIAHFEIPNCALHTSKSHIVHFQIQSCTLLISKLRIPKLHTSKFQIGHLHVYTGPRNAISINCVYVISGLLRGRVKCVGEIASARFQSVARRAQYRIFLFRERSVKLKSSACLPGTNGQGVTVVRAPISPL